MPDRYRQRAWPADRLDPKLRTGLILGGMGGPDGPDDVVPFLKNLFADPAVLPLPAWLGRLVGGAIVRRRAQAVRQRYRRLGCGGGSPQLAWTRRQAAQIARLLGNRGLDVLPSCAMRYWHPYGDEAITGLVADGARQLLIVPMYPQYSSATTGSILQSILDATRRTEHDLPLHVAASWHDLPDTLVEQILPHLLGWAGQNRDPRHCGLVFAAHSLPRRFVAGGDPYLEQTRQTVDLVYRRVSDRLGSAGDWLMRLPGHGRPLLAFQSKVGPVKWVGPDLVDVTRELAGDGCRRLLVVPVSFTCEHIETDYELDIEMATIAANAGIDSFVRTPALNLNRDWLFSLAAHLAEAAFVDDTLSPSEHTAAQAEERHVD